MTAGQPWPQTKRSATQRRLLRGAMGIVIAIAVWWCFVDLVHPRSLILPAPQDVARRLGELWSTGTMPEDLRTSLVEFVLGFVPGVVSGIAVGAVIARSQVLARLLTPPVEIFRVIIPFSLVPLAVIWFGTGISGKIFVVWYATVFVVIVNTMNAMRNVDPLLVRVARMLGYSSRAITWRVILPAALPRIIAGVQVATSFGWVSVIAAEYIGASSGLGYLITSAQQGLDTATVMAGMVVIGIIGALLSLAASAAERMLVPYREQAGW